MKRATVGPTIRSSRHEEAQNSSGNCFDDQSLLTSAATNRRKRRRILTPKAARVVAVTTLALLAGSPSVPAQRKPSGKPPPAPPAQRLNLPGEVSDERIEDLLDAEADRLIRSGRTVKMKELLGQLNRRSCSIVLPKAANQNKFSAAEVIARGRAGVLVIGDLFKCKKCPRWHVGASSGFVLTDSGVCVTCYHVANVPESQTLIAMTGDGRVIAVKEVLAANPNTDVAVLK